MTRSSTSWLASRAVSGSSTWRRFAFEKTEPCSTSPSRSRRSRTPGKVFGASKIARDITERKRAEESLREADRRKDEFLATLAHELRNPLAPIRNSLHILEMAGQSEPGIEYVREMMDRQVNHMVRL